MKVAPEKRDPAGDLACRVQNCSFEEAALSRVLPRGSDVFIARLIGEFGEGKRPALSRIRAFIAGDRIAMRVAGKVVKQPRLAPMMIPAAGAPETWEIPCLTRFADVVEFLGIEPTELAWLVDGRVRHYDYEWIEKRSGSRRLIEKPKLLLKCVQRRILAGVLDEVPPHACVHGFRRGRSIKTFAEPHVGQRVVLRMDLREFFPSLGRARVNAFFRAAGYPEDVAVLLGKLCTASTPSRICEGADDWHSAKRLGVPHLPQGAPTSPALANLLGYRLDCRLAGLAKSMGARYTRYADDLGFSGGNGFRRSLERFIPQVGAIILEEGFEINMRKNRVMGRGMRQRLAGVVVNERTNTGRRDRDALRSILHNSAVHGVESQNRAEHPDFRAHLRGRIAAVAMLNPQQGERLLRVFEMIEWESNA